MANCNMRVPKRVQYTLAYPDSFGHREYPSVWITGFVRMSETVAAEGLGLFYAASSICSKQCISVEN